MNSVVGDLIANRDSILAAARRAHAAGAQVVLTPELSLAGYPPEDLLLRASFLQRTDEVLSEIAEASTQTPGLAIVVGHPWARDGELFNAASVFRDGALVCQYAKLELPNYAVFDERRYFRPDGAPTVFEVEGIRLGLAICEDVWFPRAGALARAEGAQALLVLNASPFHLGKFDERLAVMRQHVSRQGLPAVFCNLVGGQDELVFDGDSFALNRAGEVVARSPQFVEHDLIVALDASGDALAQPLPEPSSAEAQAYAALVLGTRDYVRKNGFRGGVIGLSGGVDSALTLAIAVDALGADQVTAVMMPSRYTADISLEDAAACAKALGVALTTIPIGPITDALEAGLAPSFQGLAPDLTEENLQSRARGTLLMALSNKTGRLVLTTGNKSELAVGYCTLYGDMAGAYSVIKDLLKGWVYRLSHHRNRVAAAVQGGPVIPERILTRAPSAELRPNQTDQDSLPPYDVLDDILARFVERGERVTDIVATGHDKAVVLRVLRLLRLSEYKRRQAAPGPRITPRAFGRDWRYPLTNRFSEQEYLA